MFPFEREIDKRMTRVGTKSETERFELLANHRRPNYRGGAKFPRTDGGTVWKHFSQVEIESLCAERNVVVSSAHWNLSGRGQEQHITSAYYQKSTHIAIGNQITIIKAYSINTQ